MIIDDILSYCIRCAQRWQPLGKVLKYGKHYTAFSVKQIQQDGSVVIKNYDADDEIIAALCRECLKDTYYEDLDELIQNYTGDGIGPVFVSYINKESKFYCSICNWSGNRSCPRHSPLSQLSGQRLVTPEDFINIDEYARVPDDSRIKRKYLKRQQRGEALVNMWR